MNAEKNNLAAVIGPTASGKTRLAVHLAAKFNGEIISADSRQVYKWMNIGTGKDIEEYTVNNVTIPYHIVDVISPEEEYNLFSYIRDFNSAFEDIKLRGRLPILTGGTGLYLNAVLNNYELRQKNLSDDEIRNLYNMSFEELRELYNSLSVSSHNTTDSTSKERLIDALSIMLSSKSVILKPNQVNPIIIAIWLERDEIKRLITERLKKRLKAGMIEEVELLLKKGISYEKLNFFGLEYRYIAFYLSGELNYNDMFQKLNSAIHVFAKKQITWLRKMEKEGLRLHWIKGADFGAAEQIIQANFR